MARSRSRSSRTLVLRHSVPIEVTPLPFKPLAAVQNLDLGALARVSSARIEVGHYETGCCRRAVHAVIRKGMLTKFEVDPCKDPVRMPPELQRIVREAGQTLRARSAKGDRFPLPVGQLPSAVARIKWSIWVCVKLCCFGYCLTCCFDSTTGAKFFAKCGVAKAP